MSAFVDATIATLTAQTMAAWVEAAQTRVVVDTGQLCPATRRKLQAMARKGLIAQWRGYWAPIAGASFGMGPLKTCYGPIGSKERLP